LSQADFAALAMLAWMKDPAKSLATQLAEGMGVELRSAQRWLNPAGPPAPFSVVMQTVQLARQANHHHTELLRRAEDEIRAANQ
jgi:hypothetical protein